MSFLNVSNTNAIPNANGVNVPSVCLNKKEIAEKHPNKTE